MEHRVITPADADYPAKLKERLGDNAPGKLYYNGPLQFLDRFSMSVLCSDESGGIELIEVNQILFSIREYDMNYIGSWHSVIESEIFRLSMFRGFNTRKGRKMLLGERTLTLCSAKGLDVESYDSFLLDRFFPPLHEFPERNEYFRRAAEGELLMLSVSDPADTKQSRKNIMERNWLVCALGDIVFIPFGPKGTKTHITAKKAVAAGLPVFTMDHPTCSDLHKIGIPGYNRKTVRAFLEERGAKIHDRSNSGPVDIIPESPKNAVQIQKRPVQINLV